MVTQDLSHLPDLALSIRQPWAWSIVHANKDIENRSRRFHYRGRICIHASKTNRKAEFKAGHAALVAAYGGSTAAQMVEELLSPDVLRRSTSIRLGGIIGTAVLIGCVDQSDSPWFVGPYGLVLRNVQETPFIPVSGTLGLFKWKERLDDR